ncbi:MAG: putative anti-sigma-YlaC factor YlaD [Myxococcota bacterium]|jgi:predicted anti-sigma-YlaC factor YlaD
MLTCRELTDVVTAYLEGRLPAWTRMGIWMHIQMCSHCRRYFRQIDKIRLETGKMPPLEMPADVAHSMNDIFAQAHALTKDAAPEPEGQG